MPQLAQLDSARNLGAWVQAPRPTDAQASSEHNLGLRPSPHSASAPMKPHSNLPRIEQCLAEARRIRETYAHDLLAFVHPYRIVDGHAASLYEAARAIRNTHVRFRRGRDDRSGGAYEMARPPFAASQLGADCDAWNLAILGSICNLFHIGCAALFWPSPERARHATLLVGDQSIDLTIPDVVRPYKGTPRIVPIWRAHR